MHYLIYREEYERRALQVDPKEAIRSLLKLVEIFKRVLLLVCKYLFKMSKCN